MKLNEIVVCDDYFSALVSNYLIVISLKTKIDGSNVSCHACINDYTKYLEIIDFFGNLNVTSFKFDIYVVYFCFFLDNDLFDEFRVFLKRMGICYD